MATVIKAVGVVKTQHVKLPVGGVGGSGVREKVSREMYAGVCVCAWCVCVCAWCVCVCVFGVCM